jgi:ATP-dependent exoDNAse (exonuclease V) alpha subunit
VVALTPGGTYGMLKAKWPKNVFGQEWCDLLVLDEASQMSLPEAIMAALPLKPNAPLIVVGDNRQMPPIVQHDWESEARRTFRQYQVYESLFDTLPTSEANAKSITRMIQVAKARRSCRKCSSAPPAPHS